MKVKQIKPNSPLESIAYSLLELGSSRLSTWVGRCAIKLHTMHDMLVVLFVASEPNILAYGAEYIASVASTPFCMTIALQKFIPLPLMGNKGLPGVWMPSLGILHSPPFLLLAIA
jgi:hypothetical protein